MKFRKKHFILKSRKTKGRNRVIRKFTQNIKCQEMADQNSVTLITMIHQLSDLLKDVASKAGKKTIC